MKPKWWLYVIFFLLAMGVLYSLDYYMRMLVLAVLLGGICGMILEQITSSEKINSYKQAAEQAAASQKQAAEQAAKTIAAAEKMANEADGAAQHAQFMAQAAEIRIKNANIERNRAFHGFERVKRRDVRQKAKIKHLKNLVKYFSDNQI